MGKTGIEDLIEKLRLGDEMAFHALFNEFYASLCLFAKKYIDDQDAAEDIVQEAFVKYWDKRADFDNSYKLKSYLYLIVRNSCLNHIRDRKKLAQIHEGEEVEADEKFLQYLMEEEAYRILYKAIEELPEQMRAVILHALQGAKNAEIAELMQLSEQSVQTYKKRAYKKLRDSLRENNELLSLLVMVLES